MENEEKKTEGELLSEKLTYKKKSFYELTDAKSADAAYEFSKGYMKFLDESKTEREAVSTAIAMAKEKGYSEYKLGGALKKGGKYYYNNHGKSLFLFIIGKEKLENGIRITASHVDSPRIDLKQNPVYEEGGMSFFKTHYYGGLKKYQWTAIPLALHGVVTKADGTTVEIRIGEDDGDPIFYINDILPHLGYEQAQKPLGQAIPGESLNLLAGSRPIDEAVYDKKASDKIKLNTLRLLNEKYGITENDFISAELCAVPAFKARDVGLDRSLIGSYGHDDRVCAYPAIMAILGVDAPKHTLMSILADKEEIGSEGVSGMKCCIITDIIDEIAAAFEANPRIVRANSKCLSSDVTAAYDPNFASVFEIRNSAIINSGVALSKFTGSRGKSGTNDASAEYIGWLRGVLAKDNVVWQTAELGKVDGGGGGTVAMYIANHNIETVDLGVPVISMHAPYEIISKADIYEAYRAFSAFSKND